MSDVANAPDAVDARGKLVLTRRDLGNMDGRGNGWLGMIMLIVTEACLFAFLLFSYYYMALHYGRSWLPEELPSFKLSAPNTAILIASSVAVWLGERAIRRDSRRGAFAGLLAGFVLGCIFVAIQVEEWMGRPFTLGSDSYSSLFFTVTGFHLAHVVVGLLLLAALAMWTGMGLFDRRRRDAISCGAIYWHFVDAVWLTVFFTLYVAPNLFYR